MLVSSSSPIFSNDTILLKCYLDCAVPVFTRPAPTTCSCSIASTCTSGDNTPPLLLFNRSRSSISGGLQSSINLSQIYFALSNATHMITLAMPTVGRNRVCTCAQGTGHQQRYSKSHISHSSMYKTIEEGMLNTSSPAKSLLLKKISPTTHQPVFIVFFLSIVYLLTPSISIPDPSTWKSSWDAGTFRAFCSMLPSTAF